MTIATFPNEKTKLVTPKMLETAKSELLRLVDVAFVPHPVKQPDGSYINLCLSGRITRGYALKEQATKAGDAGRVAIIEKAIKALETEYDTAAQAANRAAKEWEELNRQLGKDVNPFDLYPGPCDCQGCTAARSATDYWDAQTQLAKTLYALFTAGPDRVPQFVELMRKAKQGDKEANEALWRALVAIYSASEAYIQASANHGVEPAWRGAMHYG